MHRVVLLRHGQSVWNQDKRFTGWTDVGLSERGVADARAAGKRLAAAGYTFDVCFSSVLRRATETARVVLAAMGLETLPLHTSWRLNERHYGALQGLSLFQGIRRYGFFPVVRCQRRFGVPPPLLPEDDPRRPTRDPLYAGADPRELPAGESVRDTLRRTLPYWQSDIVPPIRRGQRVLVVAHRNTLRALIKHIENLPEEAAPRIKVPTAVPLIYDLDEKMHAVRCLRLGKET
jgi:2,3-bisphosphoglycerate-dependent phosphoglycerate mutase